MTAPGRVTVTSAHGSIEASAALDERLRPGTVSLTHGRGDSPAGRLTSATADVDPLTAMPLASGLPVTSPSARRLENRQPQPSGRGSDGPCPELAEPPSGPDR